MPLYLKREIEYSKKALKVDYIKKFGFSFYLVMNGARGNKRK
jgi:hypothetical protein